jgi:hypothetical protein
MFSPPSRFIIHETAHWRVNQRTDTTLPGYLIVSTRDAAATSFEDLSTAALAELGPVLRDASASLGARPTRNVLHRATDTLHNWHSLSRYPTLFWVVAASAAIRAIGRWNGFSISRELTTSMAPDMCPSFPEIRRGSNSSTNNSASITQLTSAAPSGTNCLTPIPMASPERLEATVGFDSVVAQERINHRFGIVHKKEIDYVADEIDETARRRLRDVCARLDLLKLFVHQLHDFDFGLGTI